MKHVRRITRDIEAADLEIVLIKESGKPAKIQCREIAALEAKKLKLLQQLPKKEKIWNI